MGKKISSMTFLTSKKRSNLKMYVHCSDPECGWQGRLADAVCPDRGVVVCPQCDKCVEKDAYQVHQDSPTVHPDHSVAQQEYFDLTKTHPNLPPRRVE